MAEHTTEIAEPGWERSAFYFHCTCGACGTQQPTRDGAEEEASKHHDWVNHQ